MLWVAAYTGLTVPMGGRIEPGWGAKAHMSRRAEPGADVAVGRYAHLVGLFATRAELVANVVDFVAPALRDVDGVAVVVAAPDHRAAITAALAEAGLDPECDRCVFLDVDAVLASFMGDGAADRDRLRTTVGGVLDAHLDASRHVRVYAELAGRLWGRDEVVAAMQVEEWADELARDRSFGLLCFYPTELFGDQDADGQALQTVFDAHTGMVHGDLLGSDAPASGAPLGEVVHEEAVAQAMDHHTVRRERDALRQALRDVTKREQVRQAFTAMVVHDICAPTMVIEGLPGVLQRRMAELDPARVADFLAIVLRNTERIERLIDDVLTVSQLESEGFRYDLAPVDLGAVAAEVAAEMRQTRRREVEVSVDPDLPAALADVDRQVQVLENLLSNAAKFSPAGTPIVVRIEQHDDRLLVHVRDQGRGIATHELDRWFEPFSRLESSESDKVSGTGLGLYVTKMLVEGQGGTIDIASTPGQGTTVTYTVPIATVLVSDRPPTDQLQAVSATTDGAAIDGVAQRSDDEQSEHDLLEQLAEIARRLSEADDLDQLLQLIVDLGEGYLEGCDGVSMMMIGKNRTVSSPAYSSRIAYESDLAQYEADEGPCLDALRDHAVYQIDDLETETRWPEYRARALSLGVRSMLCYRLYVRGASYGALDFYSKRPHAYSAYSKVTGQVFASHAGVALKGAITEAGLERAIQSRDIIGQAKGVLMERLKLPPGESFAALTKMSQDLNVPVREIADQIVTTGEIPGDPA